MSDSGIVTELKPDEGQISPVPWSDIKNDVFAP
jgi:hypothetical protein